MSAECGRPAVVWFRDDLRVADNPALVEAASTGRPVVCLYVWDAESPGLRPHGGAARWWLHHSLLSLSDALETLGGRLTVRRGPAASVLADVIAETAAAAVFWNRRYGAAEPEIDARVKTEARAAGLEAASFAASLLFEPWTVQTGSGTPFSVFTPFWRACLQAPPPRPPLDAPPELPSPATHPDSVAVDDLDLLPSDPDRDRGLREAWTPGEASAHRALHDFLTEDVARYDLDRDTPGIAATSRLSPRLRWGELSPNQVWYATGAAREAGNAEGCAAFLGELGWREFAYHTLYRHPRMATENIRAGFDGFPWPPLDGDALTAWKHGRTGIPLVDAGMRELRRTGTMHNRVRMVVASFLTKNLLIDWREGERWFWDALVDADPASNPFNWQWVAGSGVDAAPYFRIFNPELQRTTFDPHGDYVRRWVPEWGTDAYPDPVVDLAETRRAALAAYEQVKRR